MKLQFIWIGKTKNPHLLALEEDYLARLKPLFRVGRVVVRETRKSNRHQGTGQMRREAERLRLKLSPRAYLVALDEGGRQFSSRAWARFLEGLMERGVPQVQFLVGGFQGIPPELLPEADLKLSLGKMTWPHELTRVLLLEQVYRAAALMRNLPYPK